MQVAQFPGGHSNLTYHVRFGSTELVIHGVSRGPVPPTAHDMAREYRWLSAIDGSSRSRRACMPSVKIRGRRLGVLRDGTAAWRRHSH